MKRIYAERYLCDDFIPLFSYTVDDWRSDILHVRLNGLRWTIDDHNFQKVKRVEFQTRIPVDREMHVVV